MKELKVRITFTEEVLGSQCADKEMGWNGDGEH